MDLQAAKSADPRASTLARVAILACFTTASLMLLASLNVARGNSNNAVPASTAGLTAN
jgi:hypothetical protein